MTNDHESVSLAKACKLLRYPGGWRSLLRTLRAREGVLGVRIVTELKGPKVRRYRVTVAAVRQHAPDLVPSRTNELLRETRGYLQSIDERIERVAAETVLRRVAPDIAELRRTDEELATILRDLGNKLSRVLVTEGTSLPRGYEVGDPQRNDGSTSMVR